MNLATFCHDTEPLACDWTPDLTGVHDAGQLLGGPDQRGRSYEARIVNDDAPHSAVQLITYVTESGGEYRVHLLAVWCTWDPATIEITWSAERVWDMRDPWPTQQGAAFVASECAWAMASAYGRLVLALDRFGQETFRPVLGWDGQPFEGGIMIIYPSPGGGAAPCRIRDLRKLVQADARTGACARDYIPRRVPCTTS